MNLLYAYLCPVCASVEIGATRRVGAYHRVPTFRGYRTHALVEAGTFDAALELDEIKRRVLAADYNGGVREIESESRELPRGTVVYQKAKAGWKRKAVRR